MNAKNSGLDAASLLLQSSAREAAKSLRKEKSRLIPRLFTSFFHFLNQCRIERNCRKGKHVINHWSMWMKEQKIFSTSNDSKGLPIEIRNVYIGTCCHCQKPHVRALNTSGKHWDGDWT